jgi:hypothetical protein
MACQHATKKKKDAGHKIYKENHADHFWGVCKIAKSFVVFVSLHLPQV